MAELPPHLRRGIDRFEKIESDRACANCNYNLRGLSTGDRCPECGTPAGVSIPNEDWISSAPISYLRPFSRGAMITGVMVPIQIIANSLAVVSPGSIVITGCASLTGAIYAVGIRLLTVERPSVGERSGESEWSVTRKLSRATQWGWCVGAIAATCAAAISSRNPGAPATAVFSLIHLLAMLSAVAGLFPLLVYVVRIAQWAGDSEFAERLRMLPIFLPISAGLVVVAGLVGPRLSGGVVTFLLMPIAGMSILFLLFGGFTSLRTCWNLASLGFWVIRNREENLASSQRRSARIVRRVDDAMARKAKPLQTDDAPIDLM